MRRLLLFIALCAAALVQGEIVETKHFKEIHSHLSPGTLVILDIDDTLLVPVQMLGCDEWFTRRLALHKKEGMSAAASLEASLAEWLAVRHLTEMEMVESGTHEIVRTIQNQGYTVMALTTQDVALATRTKLHLLEHEIDLTHKAPSKEEHYLNVDGRGVLFSSGILFTGGCHKGRALFGLLEKLGYTPQRILFINDKLTHLQSLEETAKQKSVEFIGLRYGYSDARKAAYNEEIADYQFTHSTFSRILSDEEAKKHLSLKEPSPAAAFTNTDYPK